ncbi:hypothetical protein JMG10_00475 [Nostoc ellipsosporum NOK]|nr:hypothetical protein [Nostoc ellipsosporum NOK]
MSETNAFINLGFLLLVVLIGLYLFQRLTLSYKLLVGIQILTLVSAAAQWYMGRYFGRNNVILHIYTPLNAILFGLMYHSVMQRVKSKMFVRFATVILLLFCIADSFFIQGVRAYPHYELIAVSIVYVAFALLSNYEMIRYSKEDHVMRSSIFWVNSSVILFFSINFIFWSLTVTCFASKRPSGLI